MIVRDPVYWAKLLAEDISEVWDPRRFSLDRKPVMLGSCLRRLPIGITKYNNLRDLPIKLPGQGLRMLKVSKREACFVKRFVDTCWKLEKSINPDAKNYYAYLTLTSGAVDRGGYLIPPGLRFDGMQGPRYKQKIKVCHQYTVAMPAIVQYFITGWDATDLDEKKDDWFKAASVRVPRRPAHTILPGEIFASTAYQCYDILPVKSRQSCLLMKLEFSLKKHDRVGNSTNPEIPAWTPRKRLPPKGIRVWPPSKTETKLVST